MTVCARVHTQAFESIEKLKDAMPPAGFGADHVLYEPEDDCMYESADPAVIQMVEAAQILSSMSAMPSLNCDPDEVHLSSEYDRRNDVALECESSAGSMSSANTPQKK